MAEFPLWRLRPEEAARIIILEPLRKTEHHKFWRKREMRIKPSHRSAPRDDDQKTLDKAANGKYWPEWRWLRDEAFPVISVLIGPMCKDGLFWSQKDHVHNSLLTDRPRNPWQGMYSREQYEQDVAYYEEVRALLRENYILGQRKEGPYLDGILFMKADNLLLAEQEHCKARLQATRAILDRSRREQAMKSGKRERKTSEQWQNIGADEALAFSFKQSGYRIKKIDTLTNRHWEVLIK